MFAACGNYYGHLSGGPSAKLDKIFILAVSAREGRLVFRVIISLLSSVSLDERQQLSCTV